MGNPFGRSIIVPLTNQSGGSVAAGDLVYIDTANNGSFKTGTTANYTKGIGIAQQTIGAGSIGLVLLAGYASLVNVNASVTRGNFLASYTVAKQGTDAGSSRAAGTCGMFLTGGTTPDAIVWQPDLGAGSGMTNPMSAVGDIIQGTTAGAPAALAAPAAGKVLTGAGTTTPLVYSYPPGYEFDYAQITAGVNITATTEATAQVVVTGNSKTWDGSTLVMVHAFAPFWNANPTAGPIIVLVLWDDTAGASLGKMGVSAGQSTSSPYAVLSAWARITPASGTRTLSIRAFVSGGTGAVNCGAGGVGNYMPGFIRITKAA